MPPKRRLPINETPDIPVGETLLWAIGHHE
jgi:hypothetical protein